MRSLCGYLPHLHHEICGIMLWIKLMWTIDLKGQDKHCRAINIHFELAWEKQPHNLGAKRQIWDEVQQSLN